MLPKYGALRHTSRENAHLPPGLAAKRRHSSSVAARLGISRSAGARGTVRDVITEITSSRVRERGASRIDDRRSESAMEDRKRLGYF